VALPRRQRASAGGRDVRHGGPAGRVPGRPIRAWPLARERLSGAELNLESTE